MRRLAWTLGLLCITGCADEPATAADASRDVSADIDDRPSAPPPDVYAEPPTDASRCGEGAVPYNTRIGLCARREGDPSPAPGRCQATVDATIALAKANEVRDGGTVLLSGRRVRRASDRIALPGYPMSMLAIPGTSFVAVSDGGFALETLRLVDTSGDALRIPAGGEAPFPSSGGARAPALFYGLAWDPNAHVLYASGGGNNYIYAFTVTPAGALVADASRTLDIGFAEGSSQRVDPVTGELRSAFPAGLALSDDGTELYAALQRGHVLGVFSTVTRALVRRVDLTTSDSPSPYPYVVARRPGDAGHVWVSLWGAGSVAEIDLAMNRVSRRIAVGKNPTEMLFTADGSRLRVTTTDSDAVATIDLSLPDAPVRTQFLGGAMTAPRGISPTALAAGRDGRLYVVDMDNNAVDVLDGESLARVGRIPTEWQPTDVEVLADGRVMVTTGRGLGKGPNLDPGHHDITDTVVGSVARYAAPTPASLAEGQRVSDDDNRIATRFNDVRCPDGAPYDFPVPRPGTGPSTRIEHVILILRENKTYDALLGDWPGTPGNPADGDPTLTLVPRENVEQVFPNFRGLVTRFASLDNYYIASELSNQGHTWVNAGRLTDFGERTWMLHDGRSTRGALPPIGTSQVGLPEEGDLWAAFRRERVSALNWGEIVGTSAGGQRAGSLYPGVAFNNSILDTEKARAFIDRVLGTNSHGDNPGGDCELPQFTMLLLPNDHTQGGSSGAPTPISHYQDNDEATGMVIDAVSHSTSWPTTLIAVIEDDPAQGGDHVDNHRTVALLASPWVKRGYVSHVHYDLPALHRTIELILGMPAHNDLVAQAAPMYDAFTATPDLTPYTYVPRRQCATYNPPGRWAEATAGMDLSQPDNAPGLDRLVWRMLHDGREPPWSEAPDEDDDD